MNLAEYREAVLAYDQLQVWGHTLQADNGVTQLVGVTVGAGTLTLYGLSRDDDGPRLGEVYQEDKEWPRPLAEGAFYLTECRTMTLDGQSYQKTHSGGHGFYEYAWEAKLMLAEFLRQGFVPHPSLANEELEQLVWTTSVFQEPCLALPAEPPAEVVLSRHERFPKESIDESFWLDLAHIDSEQPQTVQTQAGERVFYIEQAELVDVWEMEERRYDDPRYQERFSQEEIAQFKEEMQQALPGICPRDRRLVCL